MKAMVIEIIRCKSKKTSTIFKQYLKDIISILKKSETKKVTKNPINKNDTKCFQYAATVALNNDKIREHLLRIQVE